MSKQKGRNDKARDKRSTNNRDGKSRNSGYGRTDSKAYRDSKFCNFQKSADNDISWYTLNDQLLFDSANIPYSYALGNRLNLGQYGSGLNDVAFPGIMAIYTMPTIGYAQDANAPINTAARNLYSFIRHANSGGTNNIDAVDYMLYMLAMDNAYSFHAWLKRIYGVIANWDPENKYYPRALVQAMTVNFDDIQKNLADFRLYINIFANKIGSMCTPASMSYFAKHMWLYSGYYLDSVSSKAQTYLFNPYGFMYYDLFKPDGTGDETRGCMKFIPMTGRSAALTFEDIVQIGDTIINPILASQDFNVISGDILKAFGESELYKVSEITETYVVAPSYSEEVLDQIQNLTCIGDVVGVNPYGTGSTDQTVVNQLGMVVVDQAVDIGTGFLYSRILFTENEEPQNKDIRPTGLNYLESDKIVTFEYENVTTANTMEATRMCNTLEDPSNPVIGICPTAETNVNVASFKGSQRWVHQCTTMGSEVACFARIYYYSVNSNGNWALLNTEKYYTTHCLPLLSSYSSSEITDAFTAYNRLLTAISNFRRHPALVPIMGIYGPTGSIATNITRSSGSNNWQTISLLSEVKSRSTMNGMIFDVNKYAIVEKRVLQNMSEAALMSMFNVRQFGKSDKYTNILV